jgi:signal transduction histidine kinase
VTRLLRVASPSALDVALAVVFTVLGVLEPLSGVSDGFDAGPPWLTVAIGVCMGVPLAVRRRAPAVCLLTMCGAQLLPSLVVPHGEYFWSQLLPLSFAVYSTARWLAGSLGRFAWLFPLVAVEADVLHSVQARAEGGPWLPLLLFGGSALAGRLTRRSAAEAAELAVTLERLAEEQSARERAAVENERTRIAVEMHDVVAHAVSVMVLQVGAARLGLEQHEHAVPDQLRAAETTGRQALAELRHSVGALREDPSPPLQPLPGLDDLPELMERFRSAGLDVALEVAISSGLPAGLQLSVYRLVQEGLTNVLKHAGPVRVTGAVRMDGEEVVVALANPASSVSPKVVPSGGHGLVGMRERVAMYGGRLEACVRDGSFQLCARMRVPVASEGFDGAGLVEALP